MGTYRVILHAASGPELAEMAPESVALWWDVLLLSQAEEPAIRDVFLFVEGDHG